MTDLAIDRYTEIGTTTEWDWPPTFVAPQTLTEATFPRRALRHSRPDASASWATDGGFWFDTITPEVPVIHVDRSTAARAWFMPVLKALDGLYGLRPNWNGYGEAPVDLVNAARVISVLAATDFDGPAPSIVPLHDGGVQAEWHWGERHLEIQFLPGGSPAAWWCDASGEDEWEVAGRNAIERLRQYLATLAVTP